MYYKNPLVRGEVGGRTTSILPLDPPLQFLAFEMCISLFLAPVAINQQRPHYLSSPRQLNNYQTSSQKITANSPALATNNRQKSYQCN